MCMPIDAVPDDVDALRALVNQLSSERDAAIAESRRLTEQNDQLRHLLKQLQRAQFGQRSERHDRDQMQLASEDIETSLASRDAEEQEHQNDAADKPADQRRKRCANRGVLPAHLPHVHVTLEPESKVCPCCHGAMHVIGKRAHSGSTRFQPSTRSSLRIAPNMAVGPVRAPWSRRRLRSA
jgi:transposase